MKSTSPALLLILTNRPLNEKELFNLRHAQARNIVERVFGIFKRRFKILVSTPEYSIDTQACLVQALAVAHNFIRIHDPDDEPDVGDAAEESGPDTNRDVAAIQNVTRSERSRATQMRDRIAADMWKDYQEYLRRN